MFYVTSSHTLSFATFQLILEDMPEVPTKDHSEEVEDLDLPDVPTQTPITSNANANAPAKNKGFYFLLSLSLYLFSLNY